MIHNNMKSLQQKFVVSSPNKTVQNSWPLVILAARDTLVRCWYSNVVIEVMMQKQSYKCQLKCGILSERLINKYHVRERELLSSSLCYFHHHLLQLWESN